MVAFALLIETHQDKEILMKLYYAPRTRASRPRWLLEELEVPYELVTLDLSKKEHKERDYLRVHPLGVVPALVDGDTTIYESVAICMYLADKFPEKKMAPAPGSPERGKYYQWMVYAVATLEPPLAEYASHTQFLPEDQRNPEIAAKAKERVLAAIKVVEHAMLGKMYMVAEKFSAADVVMGSLMNWANSMKLLEGAPDIASWLYDVKSRAAFKRATA